MDNFYVPMVAYDLIQVADLIGIFILDTLGRIVNSEQMGFYQIDGISNRPKTSKIHKKLLGHFNY